MYSSKENVNILTALLVRHHVRRVVVCPGSRNAPIVHNLNECPDIECFAVTDERSAGFFALGMALQEGAPGAVAVCVTSGSALLNLLPAVAEAGYQHVPLVVISADRPQEWIGQLDGQTLPQPDALGRFVRRSVSLPADCEGDNRWYCNRLVNEALLDMRFPVGAPVHINVPIAEPLFEFGSEALPAERRIRRRFPSGDESLAVGDCALKCLLEARRPMVVIGQTHSDFIHSDACSQVMGVLKQHFVVLHEALCNFASGTVCFDEVLHQVHDDERFQPDVVWYVGDSIVSKRLKRFLRQAKALRVFCLTRDGAIPDTFMHLEEVVVCQPESMLLRLAEESRKQTAGQAFVHLWGQALGKTSAHAATFQPDFSQMAAVKCFERSLKGGFVHYANSTAIRLANVYAAHPVFCNRGVNGIEGSLSTAAGFSVGRAENVFCVIGDLSFFYDQNALWNRNLRDNFRILLLNNGRGVIFNQLKGLEQSAARDRFVAASHTTTAEGICRSNQVAYRQVTDAMALQQGIDWLLNAESQRPMLLEIMTNAADDERVYRDYYLSLRLDT